MYVIRTTTTACIIRRRGCLFHFDGIYWCSLTAAFRILISGILFANSTRSIRACTCEDISHLHFPSFPSKALFLFVTREEDDIKRENERPKSDGVPGGESMFVVATALVLLLVCLVGATKR